MPKSLRSVAESRFAALTRREDAAMTALEEEQQSRPGKDRKAARPASGC